MTASARIAPLAVGALVVATAACSGPAAPTAQEPSHTAPETALADTTPTQTQAAPDLSSPDTEACKAARGAVAGDVATNWQRVTAAQDEFPNSVAVTASASLFATYWDSVAATVPGGAACFTDVSAAVDDLSRAVDSGYLMEDYLPAVTDAVASLSS